MANERAQGTAVFPAGMTLRLEPDGAVVGNQGDVVIEGDISKSLGSVKQVFSEQGSVEISAPAFKATQIEASAGEVLLHGSVKAKKITGGSVRATGGKVTSHVIIAEREIELSGKSIKVELVVAPKVAFGAETKGRATAVECENEIGASKVRGRLNLADYVDIVAGAKEVLEANGIPVPDTDEDEEDDEDESSAAAAVEAVAEPEEVATSPPEDEESEESAEESDALQEPRISEDASDEIAAFDSEEIAAIDSEEIAAVEDVVLPAGADLPSTEVESPPPTELSDLGLSEEEATELHGQLSRALDKIDEAYADSEIPPPVVFLKSLVAEQRFDYIKTQINSMWSDLLKYHQKKGLYISNAVTHQFQQIQMAMRRLPDA